MRDPIPKLFDPVTDERPHEEQGKDSLTLAVLTTSRALLWSVGNMALVVWVMFSALVMFPAYTANRRAEAEHAQSIEEGQKRQIVNQATILLGQRKVIDHLKKHTGE